MEKLNLSWKQIAGGVAGAVAFLASAVAIVEFGSSAFSKPENKKEVQETTTATRSVVSRIHLPTNEHFARSFIRGSEDSPSERYLIVTRGGPYGNPRISQLFEDPEGGFQEKKIRDLSSGFKIIRREGYSNTIALYKFEKNILGPFVSYGLDIALFNSEKRFVSIDKFEIRDCVPYTYEMEAVLFSSKPNGYALRLNTGCGMAELLGTESQSVSLKSNGEDISDKSVLIRVFENCGDTCLISCYYAEAPQYERKLELYGTFGAPIRCPDDVFEAA